MRIFLTGATGFLGRHLLHQLASSQFASVACLVRDAERLRAVAPPGLAVTPVPGSLEEPDTYASALAGCDVVCHLAAVTGKAPAAAHYAVNAAATRTLVGEARRAGVPRFLHVSTVAARYPERERYAYAHSKELAEAAVRESGLDFAIVRPTIVTGSGSPIGKNLFALARAPLTLMFGDGRTKVQPVAVTDVATCLAILLGREELGGETLELGGADVLSFDELLVKIGREARGRDLRIVHLPVDVIIGALRLVEGVLPSALPVSSGQFYAFRYDNDAAPGATLEGILPERQGIDAIVADLVASETSPPETATVAAPVDEAHELDVECSVFCRYLIGEEPSEYVLAKYRSAHRAGQVGPESGVAACDRSLIRFARRGLRRAGIADSFAVVFSRGGVLRRKLVLLLAILESTAPTHTTLDTADRGSVLGFLLGGIGRGLRFAGEVIVGLVLCGPGFVADRRAGGGESSWDG